MKWHSQIMTFGQGLHHAAHMLSIDMEPRRHLLLVETFPNTTYDIEVATSFARFNAIPLLDEERWDIHTSAIRRSSNTSNSEPVTSFERAAFWK